jgi:4-hydroxybenzoyl-CoA reductase beta subunit
MLRLPTFDLAQPADLAAAVRLLATSGARAIQGGTDLLPNLKLGQARAQLLVGLRALPELQGIAVDGDWLRLGCGERLATVAGDDSVAAHLPALSFAAGRIASPQIRNMGTLGGNLCLDTRCRYINQSELWREALGGCLKSHGSECHVVPGGQGCVAAMSSDTVPVLLAYGAEVEVATWQDGAVHTARQPLASLYCTDGTRHVDLPEGAVLLAVWVPLPSPRTRVVYRKWAVRQSIDFPLVSVAVRLDLDGAGLLEGGRIAVGVLGPKPRVLALDSLKGRAVDESLAVRLGDMAFDRCRPLPNVPYDADYRRERLRIEVRRAVRSLSDHPVTS